MPNSNKRSYVLPAGCKNIGDVPAKKKAAALRVRVNGKITAPEVKVQETSGKTLGIYKLTDAFVLAQSRTLDLVEIKPNVTPPVCMLIDYGAFRFQTRTGKLPKKWL